jgi:hypothetical protein
MSARNRTGLRLGDRSVVELMVLTFTFVVAATVLVTGGAVAVVEILDPTVDTSRIVDTLSSVISGMLGALLGLLAGKSDALSELGHRPDGTRDSVQLPGEET